MSTVTKDNDQTFNDEVNSPIAGTDASQAIGEGSNAFRASGDITTNRNITGAIGNTSGSNNTIFGAGSSYVESLDGATVKGALDFGAAALAGSNALAGQFLGAWEKTQLKNQEFQTGLLAGFQGITEATNSTLRGALSTTLRSDALALPADTSATQSAKSTERLVFIGAGLFVAWLLTRK